MAIELMNLQQLGLTAVDGGSQLPIMDGERTHWQLLIAGIDRVVIFFNDIATSDKLPILQ